MIEMLGVLAIIGVLSAGGIMGYTAAMEAHRINQVVEDMEQMVGKAKYVVFSGNTKSIGNISAFQAHQLGILPDNYYKTCPSSTINSAWCTMKNPHLDISTQVAITGQNLYYWIYNPSERICTKLIRASKKILDNYKVYGEVKSDEYREMKYILNNNRIKAACTNTKQMYWSFNLSK